MISTYECFSMWSRYETLKWGCRWRLIDPDSAKIPHCAQGYHNITFREIEWGEGRSETVAFRYTVLYASYPTTGADVPTKRMRATKKTKKLERNVFSRYLSHVTTHRRPNPTSISNWFLQCSSTSFQHSSTSHSALQFSQEHLMPNAKGFTNTNYPP